MPNHMHKYKWIPASSRLNLLHGKRCGYSIICYNIIISLSQLLNRRSCNVLLKQSSGRSLPIPQKDSFPQETPNASSQLTVSDSEIM